MTESVNRLTEGQASPEHGEVGRLSHSWLELCHQANRLKDQRQEDLQRTQEYHDCITAMEALFEQVSKEWDNLARWGHLSIGNAQLSYYRMGTRSVCNMGVLQ